MSLADLLDEPESLADLDTFEMTSRKIFEDTLMLLPSEDAPSKL